MQDTATKGRCHHHRRTGARLLRARLGPATALLLAGLAVATPSARAHGDKVFGTRGVVAAPPAQTGAATAPLLVPLSSGALVRPTPGAPFAWLCPESLLGPTADLTAAAVTGAGSLLLGNANDGLLLSDDWGCSWRATGPFRGEHALAALALSPAAPDTWYVASNAAADGHGSVWLSEDGGRGYRRLGFAAPGVYLTDLVAAANLLVAGGTNNAVQNSAQLFFSRDGGRHWQGGVLPGAPAMTNEVRVFVLGEAGFAAAALDLATNAATVLLAERPEGPWRRAWAMGQPVRQVVADAAGRTVLVGGTTHVVRSRDGGATFAALAHPRGNGCAGAVGRALWACGDAGATPDVGDGFALASLGASADVWTTQLTYPQLTAPYHCAADSPTYGRCVPGWAEAAQRFGARAARPPNLPALARNVAHAGGRGCAAAAPSAREPWWQCGLGQVLAALTTCWVLRAPKTWARTWPRALRRATVPPRRRRSRRG